MAKDGSFRLNTEKAPRVRGLFFALSKALDSKFRRLRVYFKHATFTVIAYGVSSGAVVDKSIPPQWRRVAGHFSIVLRKLVDHRGIAAESELIETLGVDRLVALYDGAEPRFGEFLECARVLNVPLSTFQINEIGSFPELDIAYAELLYAASAMSASERAKLAEALSAIARNPSQADFVKAPEDLTLPESLLSVLRRASD